MQRREFCGVVAGGLSLGTALELKALAPAPARPDLVVVHGGDPKNLVRAALEPLGGIRRFIAKGDVVVIKPNIGWDRIPEQAATTNPQVVAALVALCLEAGARKVKVFDRTCNDPRRCYAQSGIEAAAKAAGAEVSHIEERKFREVPIPGGVAIKSWPLYAEALEADKLINVPIAKHHSLSKVTLGMKNWMGIMGGNRGQVHQRIDDALVDLATVVKPTLVLLDAIRILTGHGPQGGSLSDVKKVDLLAAGTDPVAVDAWGATLFGRQGSDLGYVAKGAQRGLGVMDLGRIRVQKLEA
ncbi:MAG: DUF362 domain-containing protein [Acidobacteria bacterium]|nr:DUF362 domain-containing protein [Acidobacteriota bacterium]